MSDLASLTLAEAADAVTRREATSAAPSTACLARLDAAEERVIATIWLDREGAHRAAEAADRQVADGVQ